MDHKFRNGQTVKITKEKAIGLYSKISLFDKHGGIVLKIKSKLSLPKHRKILKRIDEN